MQLMSKNKKIKGVTISDFFGTIKNYHIQAIKSTLELYPFAMKVGKNCRCQFSYLGEYTPPETDHQPVFRMMHAQMTGLNHFDIVIFENKTTHYHSDYLKKSSKEKNVNFQTLFLFKDPFYLFDNKMPAVFPFPKDFKTPVSSSYDYLMLIYFNKENRIDDFVEQLKRISGLQSVDMSDVLVSTARGSQKTIAFLQKLFYDVEVRANRFVMEERTKLLGDINKILPKNNLTPSNVDLPLFVEDEYLNLLIKDVSFE